LERIYSIEVWIGASISWIILKLLLGGLLGRKVGELRIRAFIWGKVWAPHFLRGFLGLGRFFTFNGFLGLLRY